MIEIRAAKTRGHANHGWLDSYHTFSFADYHDPDHINFGHLRVINEDRVQPGTGFPTHGHSNMEIVTYVLEGELEHKDSMGNGSIIHPGDVQRMSAGTGVRHSEFNASASAVVHFLQIWILPNATGLVPSYEQRHFESRELDGKLRLIVSSDGHDGSLVVHQDMSLYAGRLTGDQLVRYKIAPGRRVYVQMARGSVRLNGLHLTPGDGARVTSEGDLSFDGGDSGEFLLFDLA